MRGMNIKFRVLEEKTLSRTETQTCIEQVRFKDNLVNKKDASVQLCFRQGSVSGIVELSVKEWERISLKMREQEALEKPVRRDVVVA